MNLGKLGQALTTREIFDLIQDDLEQVEKRITVESVASVDAVTAIGQYLQSSGGKRLRPSLLLLAATVTAWRSQRRLMAGLLCGLLFYKPQLGAVLATVLVLSLGWRALIGLSITGIALLLASLALPGTLHDFLYQMPLNLHYVQCKVPYMWDRHVTFKAFWRLLFQGFGSGEAKMQLYVTLTDLAAPQKPLYEAADKGDSGKKIGAAITMNPYVAAAKFVMEKNAPEKTVKKTAAEIAKEVETHLQ